MIRTIVGIEGMMCGMCEAHINDAVRAAFPVVRVKASRGRREAEIFSEGEIPEEKIREVIEKTGYTMTGYESKEAVKTLFGWK